ncbi:MAG TPA: hypothetical protein VMZ53_11055 [Kofleriaceae bacterium]|nr:hypothetical protein [Kofleriaceae bacterium]
MPLTFWTCMDAGGTNLVHRAELGPVLYVNSCAPGYLPLLRESSTVSTTICVAVCKPLNCYAGNCGTNAENRLGAAPHRCMNPDAAGTFDTGPNGEQCEFVWRREIDPMAGTYLPSTTSDTLGFCFDHSKYLYAANGGGPDTPLPACSDLADGFGSGSDPSSPLTYWGAADLGCVDSTHAGVHAATGKPLRRSPLDDLRPFFGSQHLSSARSEIRTTGRNWQRP